MAGEEILFSIPEEAANAIVGAVSVFKALGWAIIAYVIFSLVNMIINWVKARESKKIRRDLRDIKLLLQGKKLHEKISKK